MNMTKKKLLAALLASALAAGMLPTSACAASIVPTRPRTRRLSALTDSVRDRQRASTPAMRLTAPTFPSRRRAPMCSPATAITARSRSKRASRALRIVLNGLTLTNDGQRGDHPEQDRRGRRSLRRQAATNTVADTAGANDENAAVKVKSGACALASAAPVR